MCLITFHLNDHPTYKLILAANRDEFYARPTAPAHFWKDQPHILAGRDLEANGTWLGITKQGRIAALTNYRDPAYMKNNRKSRGEIVSNFLSNSSLPVDYIHEINQSRSLFNGYNLLLGNADQLFYYNNVEGKSQEISSGTLGLSNHFLNTPWPKVVISKNLLQDYVSTNETLDARVLFDMLLNRTIAEDTKLPKTGIELELERQLSPLFIKTDTYGTRCSTVLLIDQYNYVHFHERTYFKGQFVNERSFSFQIQSSLD